MLIVFKYISSQQSAKRNVNLFLFVHGSALREWKAKNPHRKLGNPRLHEINKVRKHKSRKFNVKVANVILPLRKQGFTFKKIAEMLNEMKLTTAEGKQFHKSQVKRIVDRSLVEA